jgi:hypothetical protein
MNRSFRHSIYIPIVAIAGLLAACAGSPTKDSTGQYVDDTTITAKVKSALLADCAVKSFETKDAMGVGGVTDVKDNLTLKGARRPGRAARIGLWIPP